MLPFHLLIGAAIVDSINPGAFGALIFLLSQIVYSYKNKSKIFINGFSYILVFFITYLIAGFLLMPLLVSLGNFSSILYLLLGIIVLLSGLAELKDFFLLGKSFSFSFIPSSAVRLKIYEKKISANILSAILLGGFVALIELPCTGAVYFAVLSIISISGYSVANIYALVLYNLILTLPLITIVLAFIFGLHVHLFERLRKVHHTYVRFAIGVLLIMAGLWMIFTSISAIF